MSENFSLNGSGVEDVSPCRFRSCVPSRRAAASPFTNTIPRRGAPIHDEIAILVGTGLVTPPHSASTAGGVAIPALCGRTGRHVFEYSLGPELLLLVSRW